MAGKSETTAQVGRELGFLEEVMSRIRILILAALPGILTGTAEAQGIIVDHTSLPLFDQIPEQYLAAAADLRMMFVDQSVGGNIDDGLTCLAYQSNEVAPIGCKRNHSIGEFVSPQSELTWSRTGGYPRSRWQYFFWPRSGGSTELPPCGNLAGMWHEMVDCFVRYVDAHPDDYDVYSFQFSYLQVDGGDIDDPATGLLARTSGPDIDDIERLQSRHPNKVFLHHTTSLARSIGTQTSTNLNAQLRAYVHGHGGYLLDVADILSHDPPGRPCYDNRDGVPYPPVGDPLENYPDDGLNTPAICQHYTTEHNAGHIGNPAVGKIRVAKAFWILMARVAGWNPSGTAPSPPANLRIIR